MKRFLTIFGAVLLAILVAGGLFGILSGYQAERRDQQRRVVELNYNQQRIIDATDGLIRLFERADDYAKDDLRKALAESIPSVKMIEENPQSLPAKKAQARAIREKLELLTKSVSAR